MSIEVDTIDRARNGDVEYFREAPLRVIQTAVSKEGGDSSFSIAAIQNKLECCKMIYSRCPSLLYHCSQRYGNSALHHAAFRGWTQLLKFLFSAKDQKDFVGEETDVQSGLRREEIKNLNLLTMADRRGYTPLHSAVAGGSVETVKMLIEADHGRDTLKMVSKANETPLHLAVKGGSIGIVTALIKANPDFEYGVNRDNETPLLMAMKQKSGSVARLLLKKQRSKIKLGIGNNGWTPIHYAVNLGDFDMVKDIINICPSSKEVVDNDGQNCLHLAAKCKNIELVQHIIGTEFVSSIVLNGKDIHGHTPLHVAALTGNEAIIKCLLYDQRVDKMTTNNKGQHVLDAITCDYDRAKAELFGATDRMTQKDWKNQSDFDLVVGALIATVSFTAGITVPGGYNSDGPDHGRAVLSKKLPFIAFVVSNNFALMFSLYAVFSHFCTRLLRRKEDISHQLKVAQYCTVGAIFAMMVAFITGSYVVLANSKWLAIFGCMSCCFFFGFAFLPVCKIVMQPCEQTRIQPQEGRDARRLMSWRYMCRCWEKPEIIEDNQIPEKTRTRLRNPAHRRYMCYCWEKQEIIQDKQEITEYQNSNQMEITTM